MPPHPFFPKYLGWCQPGIYAIKTDLFTRIFAILYGGWIAVTTDDYVISKTMVRMEDYVKSED